MGKKLKVSRRSALKLGGAAAALPLVHIRTAGAAGKLSVGFWDHWVPQANPVMQKQVAAWAEKNKVEVTADFTSANLPGDGAAEAQAKAGHDMYTFLNWDVYNVIDSFEPIDDVMEHLISQNGAVNETCAYIAKQKGHWMAVPTSSGTQTKPPCARISWFKNAGLDLQAMYPVKAEHNALQDAWTWDAFLKYAELADKDGKTFALGAGSGGTNTDATDTHGALFKAFGATLVDAKGDIQLKSDAMRQTLEFAQKLVKFYPADAVSYDDASNNRALISGKTCADLQPPIGLGGGKARRTTGCGGLLDIPRPERTEGPVPADLELLLGRLRIQPEQVGGKGPHHLPDAARAGGAALRRQRGLRHPAIRRTAGLQGMGDRRAAAGYCL